MGWAILFPRPLWCLQSACYQRDSGATVPWVPQPVPCKHPLSLDHLSSWGRWYNPSGNQWHEPWSIFTLHQGPTIRLRVFPCKWSVLMSLVCVKGFYFFLVYTDLFISFPSPKKKEEQQNNEVFIWLSVLYTNFAMLLTLAQRNSSLKSLLFVGLKKTEN